MIILELTTISGKIISRNFSNYEDFASAYKKAMIDPNIKLIEVNPE